MFELRDIRKQYASGRAAVTALDGVSIDIKAGEFVSIMGPSGSGKSTLLHILGLLDRPDGGTFNLCGVDTTSLGSGRLAALRSQTIGFIFQMFNLLPRTSALNNVALPALYASRKSVENGKDPAGLLKMVGLQGRETHHPSQLSGGEKQRVAVARALVNDPAVIVADEPTGNLDSKSTREIIGILRDLNRQGKTVIMVTHEEDIGAMADRTVRMRDGRIVSDTGRKTPDPGTPSAAAPSFESRAVSAARMVRNYFSQARKSLLANKTRSFLSILGVLIGVASVITMLALGEGARADVSSAISAMGSNVLSVRPNWRAAGSRSDATRLSPLDVEAVKNIPHVENVSGTVSGRNLQAVHDGNTHSTRVTGVEPGYEHLFGLAPERGRFFTEEENISRQRLAIIGKTVERELFPGTDPVGRTVRIERVNFNVIGVIPERGATGWRDMDDEIIIPLNTAMYRLMGRRHLDNIELSAAEGFLGFVRSEVHRVITRRHGLTGPRADMIEVRNMAELQEVISATATTFAWLLGSIAFISLLVGGVGIMNIMLVAVAERTKEIGLRKAIGATERDIMLQFVIEAVVVCVAGGVLGILAGGAASRLLSEMAGWSMRVSPLVVALAFSFSAGVGLIFGIWPARNASRLKPVDALRYE